VEGVVVEAVVEVEDAEDKAEEDEVSVAVEVAEDAGVEVEETEVERAGAFVD